MNQIVLLGDFNCELTQARSKNVVRKYRKKILSKFIKDERLLRLDDHSEQKWRYSYVSRKKIDTKNIRRRSLFENDVNHELDQKARSLSWLDMVFATNENSVDCVNIINDLGLKTESNLGDHLLLSVTLKLDKRLDLDVPKQTHKIIQKFKWTDYVFQNLYNKYLKQYTANANIYNMKITGENSFESRANKSKLINNIHHSMLAAFNQAIEKTKVRIKYKKNVAWWDETVRTAHSIYAVKLREFNHTKYGRKSTEEEIKKIKEAKNKAYSLFKKSQQLNKTILKNKEYRKLNILFCEDRIQGWKLFKKMFRLKTNTKLTASQVKKVFEEQFTTRITEASPELNEHEENVKQFLQNHRLKMEPKIIIRRARLSMILKKLRNGKRAGFSGVTYEMFK